ncbi:hypothetical protein ScPMuIL_001681 [Solemya velum]
MKLACLFTVVVCLLPVSNGFFFGGPDWNGLKVTWGLSPFGSNFVRMPRTVRQAGQMGFRRISHCTENPRFRGNRYMKDNDTAVILLFDKNGYIAGIQAGIPNNLPDNYPPPTMKPPFLEDGHQLAITAYFVDPATICTLGRTQDEFNSEGTGTNLYLQNGTDPERDSILIPRRQQDIGSTRWVEGRCFFTMGKHYWYDVTVDMNCNYGFPGFLMYNGGELNGFGWAFQTGLLTSPRYEHPDSSVLGRFITPVPTCLRRTPGFSTLHIYMTNSPRTNFC